MKTFRILLLLTVFTFSAHASEYLNNTVLVRFSNFHKDDAAINKVLEQSNAKIARRILPLEASLRYGNTTQYKSSNNSRYKEILDAEEPVLRTYVVEYKGNQSPDKFCIYLMKNFTEVEIAEPYRLQKMQGFTPNDQYIAEQEDALTLINAYEAWEIYSGDSNVVIGISDNGIDQFHPDLRNNIAINKKEIPNNGIDDDNNGFIDDYNGFNLDGGSPEQLWGNTYVADDHGTLSAGIAGAQFNNGIGVSGIGGYSKIFPIRIGTVELGSRYTAFGYESMIFAANTGIKVLNCSWGEESVYSELEQMIVTYAVANDVAIVAAGGNQEKNDQVTKFYPSGYKGVLGVGVVSSFDSFLSVSLLGPQTRIMAPASGNYTTTLNGKYTNPGNATSFSTPIVAGAVALARGQHPELNATQVLEFVRQSTDDLREKRTFYKDITPGRLNMLKMVTTDPMSIPGLMIDKVILKDRTGAEQDRFFLGDTVNVELVLKNVLGEAKNLDLNLSIAYPESFKPLTFTDSTFTNLNMKTNETKTVTGFQYVISNHFDEYINFRLDITDDKGYKDFILYDYKSIPVITTFENKDIKFSISDRGTFGYAPAEGEKRRRDGVGFIDKSYGDALHFSGMFLVENENAVIASFPLSNIDGSFRSVKPFYNPSYTASMMTSDPFEPTRALIEQTVELPKQGHWVRIKLDVTDSASLGSKYSLGYEFDWDMGVEYQYNFNTTEFLEEARPGNIPYEKFSAIYTGHKDSSQVFGTAFYSYEDDAIAQAGGYTSQTSTNSIFYSTSLQLGKVNITDTTADMFNIIGMRFTKEFAPFETKTCYLCVAGGADKTALTESLKECASNITSVEINYDNEINFNSSDNSFEINNTTYQGVEVYRIDGSIVMKTTDNRFNLNNLNQGIYLVKIEFADRFIVKKISIIR
ncbi:MAG: S8 family peptidase [Candidatus Kapaibacterium sp.]